MGRFIVRRLAGMIPLLFLISVISFIIIQLPPGDFVDSYVAAREVSGTHFAQEEIQQLKRLYGLDQPLYVQYMKWMGGILTRGDFGRSFQWGKPVRDLLWERIPRTFLLGVLTMAFIWLLAVPIGIYSAVHRYSVLDHLATFISFLGVAVPNFLFALLLMWVVYKWFGHSVTGLFSPAFADAKWSLAKFFDLLKNVWLPLVVTGASGTAGIIRVLRATLADELGKLYVTAARAKGLSKWRLIFKYPVRVALNPLISTIGWMLPAVISGEIIVAVVLNLRTVGPLLLESILSQDMYLAGSIVLILSTLTVLGTFISDILLAWLDPRIRF